MRDGKYWFNLMTEDEQDSWVCNRYVHYLFFDPALLKTYDNFEEFILCTIPILEVSPFYQRYWVRVIDKYYGPFLPTHRIKKHLL